VGPLGLPNKLFFSANNGNDGDELWTTDGTAAGTVLIADINPGGLGAATSNFVDAGSTLFLAAHDGTHGTELWAMRNRLVGDSNGDGRFNPLDLIQVLQAGEYEDGIPGNSTFEEGDWNSDGDFNTLDIVLALQAGTYEAGAL
jgi:ELWxxDGT repeat protein